MCEILKVQRAKAVEILFRREEKIQKHFLNIEENQAVCCPNQEHAAWFWLPPTVVDKPPKTGHNVRYKGITVGKSPGDDRKENYGKRNQKTLFENWFCLSGRIDCNIRRTVSGGDGR